MSLQDMYKVKKKRPVDPNAPPRPNLLSHEKVLKDTKAVIDNQADMIIELQRKVATLEAKIQNQTAYLSQLHHHIMSSKK